jgi:hypothetical protein
MIDAAIVPRLPGHGRRRVHPPTDGPRRKPPLRVLLGFEDPSALSRAFQPWTGRTPASWRAAAGAARAR